MLRYVAEVAIEQPVLKYKGGVRSNRMKLSVQVMVAKEHKGDVMTGGNSNVGYRFSQRGRRQGRCDGVWMEGMLENETEQLVMMVLVVTLIG